MDNPTPFKVLVVDDDPSIRMLLPNFLKNHGFSILKAGDGAEAIETIRNERPDLVLMDVSMPIMTGLEACKALKSSPETSSIPIVFMTSLADDADRLAGFEAGGEDYIIKPLNHMEVAARLKRYTARRGERIRQDKLREVLASCRERMDSIMPEVAAGHARDTMTHILADLLAAQRMLDEAEPASEPAAPAEAHT